MMGDHCTVLKGSAASCPAPQRHNESACPPRSLETTVVSRTDGPESKRTVPRPPPPRPPPQRYHRQRGERPAKHARPDAPAYLPHHHVHRLPPQLRRAQPATAPPRHHPPRPHLWTAPPPPPSAGTTQCAPLHRLHLPTRSTRSPRPQSTPPRCGRTLHRQRPQWEGRHRRRRSRCSRDRGRGRRQPRRRKATHGAAPSERQPQPHVKTFSIQIPVSNSIPYDNMDKAIQSNYYPKLIPGKYPEPPPPRQPTPFLSSQPSLAGNRHPAKAAIFSPRLRWRCAC